MQSKGRAVLVVVLLLAVAIKCSGQANVQKNPITLRGCLTGGSNEFSLTTDYQHSYRLTGEISGLDALLIKGTREVKIEGIEDNTNNSQPTLKVTKVVEVFERPKPHLSLIFRDMSKWQTEQDRTHGITFRHPPGPIAHESESPAQGSNFVATSGAVLVATASIPSEVYPHSNFGGGGVSVFANPSITNRESCRQFGFSDTQRYSEYKVRGIDYAEMPTFDAGSNTYHDTRHYHTFRNGQCYEIAIETIKFNTGVMGDGGCTIPEIDEGDIQRVIKPLLDGISFFHPALTSVPRSEAASVPEVLSFAASSEIADDAANRGVITFSWSTEGTDYVEFTYDCSGGASDVVILENGGSRYCGNTASFKAYSTDHFYYSPNSSTTIGLGYFHQEDSTSVIVSITPFSHGVAYPASRKTLTIIVNPYNPFPAGVPTDTRNMTISFAPSAEGTSNFRHGSSMRISWTDTRTQDPCVNLYLVQDDGVSAPKIYWMQINGSNEIGCLKPASAGTYTWTIPERHSGSGFRILARTPGGTSGALTDPFEIGEKPGLP